MAHRPPRCGEGGASWDLAPVRWPGSRGQRAGHDLGRPVPGTPGTGRRSVQDAATSHRCRPVARARRPARPRPPRPGPPREGPQPPRPRPPFPGAVPEHNHAPG
ncbi:hypothetical protein D7294_00990 [Streptomyces hoynatensis]|uniref:Uncharacterized protein n=1 Tax=Streptomyces hoynatensis TaxID=1141874 RepID=A0A3A9ZHU7_9ACTN|nr:hypothetical protein D7294_00990 [Streptomyces hoynatensis]